MDPRAVELQRLRAVTLPILVRERALGPQGTQRLPHSPRNKRLQGSVKWLNQWAKLRYGFSTRASAKIARLSTASSRAARYSEEVQRMKLNSIRCEATRGRSPERRISPSAWRQSSASRGFHPPTQMRLTRQLAR